VNYPNPIDRQKQFQKDFSRWLRLSKHKREDSLHQGEAEELLSIESAIYEYLSFWDNDFFAFRSADNISYAIVLDRTTATFSVNYCKFIEYQE
jgi:hypothetical protein